MRLIGNVCRTKAITPTMTYQLCKTKAKTSTIPGVKRREEGPQFDDKYARGRN